MAPPRIPSPGGPPSTSLCGLVSPTPGRHTHFLRICVVLHPGEWEAPGLHILQFQPLREAIRVRPLVQNQGIKSRNSRRGGKHWWGQGGAWPVLGVLCGHTGGQGVPGVGAALRRMGTQVIHMRDAHDVDANLGAKHSSGQKV